MNTAQRWWRGLDHYYWLTAFLAARGLQQTTCRLVALVILAMSAISLTLIWSPTGPHGSVNRFLAVAVALCCWGLAALWLRGRWPTVIESRICVCVGAVCIAISCLIQTDALSGLFGATCDRGEVRKRVVNLAVLWANRECGSDFGFEVLILEIQHRRA